MANRPFCCLPSGKLYSSRVECGVDLTLECGFARTKIRKISFYEKVKVIRFSWLVKIN